MKIIQKVFLCFLVNGFSRASLANEKERRKYTRLESYVEKCKLVLSCEKLSYGKKKQESHILPSTSAQSGPEVIKNMLNSAEHEILNVHKYENIKNSNLFRLRQA